MKIAGGCVCGNVRYELSAEPGFSFHCQCRQCQKVTGGGHSSQFGVAGSAVDLRGEFSVYELTADSGATVRSAFCGRCGSPLFKESTGHPESKFFHVATLDDPARFEPKAVVWSASAQPWDVIDPRLPRL